MNKTLIIAMLINAALSAILIQFSIGYVLCLWLGEILGAVFVLIRFVQKD